MIDLKKLDRDDLEFVAEMMFIFNHHDETGFEQCDIEFGVDYKDDKIWVYEDKENGRNFYFKSAEDFFEVFLLDGKQFLDKLDEIALSD